MIATFAPQLATLVFEVSKGETVRAILDRLPGKCGIDEVLSQLYLNQAVARDDTDVAAGRTESYEQVEATCAANGCGPRGTRQVM